MENLRKINSTLLLIQKDGKLLLGEKKRGFAKGTLNGIGGKQDEGETIDQTMIRETEEEIGVTPIDYALVGKIAFDVWYKGEHVNMFVYVYTCSKFSGEVKETDEIVPYWFDLDKVPVERMLEDDKEWMKLYLAGKKFVGKCKFDPSMHIISQEFKVVEKICDDEMITL